MGALTRRMGTEYEYNGGRSEARQLMSLSHLSFGTKIQPPDPLSHATLSLATRAR